MSFQLPNALSTMPLSVPAAGAAQQTPAPGTAVAATPLTLTAAGPDLSVFAAKPPQVAFGLTADNQTITSNYEWTYPNGEDGKYFTATQAQIYIGNLFIDELVSLQYAFQGNRIPIYGYCSEEADAFGSGRRLVQGQLALNFVTEGYLYTVLSEFQNTANVESAALSSAADQAAVKLANLVNQRQTLAGQQPYIQAYGNADAVANASVQLAALDTRIQAAASQGGVAMIDAAKALLAGQGTQPARSAITLATPFTIRCTMTGAGRTVQRVLTNCVLTSNEQVYCQDGSVLLDNYGFIARNAN